jgi:hypothetical protein
MYCGGVDPTVLEMGAFGGFAGWSCAMSCEPERAYKATPSLVLLIL